MYKSLMPGFLSVKADLPRSVELAARHGFAGVDAGAGSLTAPDLDVEAVRARMEALGVRPGYVGLAPGRVPASDADWGAAMRDLPRVAGRARALGFRRAALVVLPFHETLPFEAAFAEHVARLNEMTAVLDEYGIALGLEYVSAVSRRAPYPHAFAYDMRSMLALCDAANSPHLGLMLDTFHWHCAGETAADLERLRPEQVVVVHVNDAPAGVPVEEMVVTDRALPGETDVIDVAGFLGALRAIGYDGPVTCEPMAKAVAALGAADDDAVLARTSAAMDAVLARS